MPSNDDDSPSEVATIAPASEVATIAPASSSVLELKADEDVDEHFFQAGFSDGMPIVAPTRVRVTRMLRGTALAPSDVIGRCPPAIVDVTVEKLAIASVMAGCTPEMFRVVIAAAKAMLRPEFGLHGVHATTMGATPVVIVNGPCRHQAKINYEHAPLGSGNRSTSIGRALKLLLQNVGRAKLGGTESTTVGNPLKFGMCFGEWEERCGMWEPLSAEVGGIRRDEDSVTLLAAAGGPVQLVDFNSTPAELVQRLAMQLGAAYAPQMPFINNCLLVISPEHYDTLLKAGMTTKKKLSEALWRESAKNMVPHIPGVLALLGRLRSPRVPAILFKAVGMLVVLVASALRLVGIPFTRVPKFNTPKSLQVVVAGGSAGKFSCFMPGFGVGMEGMGTAFMSQPVSMSVEPRPPSLDAPEQAVKNGHEILNPASELAGTLLSLSKRTGALMGPVGLMDINKARGKELLDVVEGKLKALGVETRRYAKPTFSRPCPEELCRKISSESSFESSGLPTVCMISSGFAGQAKYQADMLNLSDVRVSFVRHPISDASPEELVGKAEETFQHAVEGIKTNDPLPVQDFVKQASANPKAEPADACET